MSRKKNPHIGSHLDDFLKAEGNFEELQTQAIKEVELQIGCSKLAMTLKVLISRLN